MTSPPWGQRISGRLTRSYSAGASQLTRTLGCPPGGVMTLARTSWGAMGGVGFSREGCFLSIPAWVGSLRQSWGTSGAAGGLVQVDVDALPVVAEGDAEAEGVVRRVLLSFLGAAQAGVRPVDGGPCGCDEFVHPAGRDAQVLRGRGAGDVQQFGHLTGYRRLFDPGTGSGRVGAKSGVRSGPAGLLGVVQASPAGRWRGRVPRRRGRRRAALPG